MLIWVLSQVAAISCSAVNRTLVGSESHPEEPNLSNTYGLQTSTRSTWLAEVSGLLWGCCFTMEAKHVVLEELQVEDLASVDSGQVAVRG